MKSYIKIYCPPLLKSIRALEKIAIDMPNVCIMDTLIETEMPLSDDYALEHFGEFGEEVPIERCNKIFSKSGEKAGEYDFYFEWFSDPTHEELKELILKIDYVFTQLGSRYLIINKPR